MDSALTITYQFNFFFKSFQLMSKNGLKKSKFFSKTFFSLHNSAQLTYPSLKWAKFGTMNDVMPFLVKITKLDAQKIV